MAGPGTARQAGAGPTVPQDRGTFPSKRGGPRSWEPSPSRAGGCKPSSRYYGWGGSSTQTCGKYFTAPVCDNAALTHAATDKPTSAAVKSCDYGNHGKSSPGERRKDPREQEPQAAWSLLRLQAASAGSGPTPPGGGPQRGRHHRWQRGQPGEGCCLPQGGHTAPHTHSYPAGKPHTGRALPRGAAGPCLRTPLRPQPGRLCPLTFHSGHTAPRAAPRLGWPPSSPPCPPGPQQHWTPGSHSAGPRVSSRDSGTRAPGPQRPGLAHNGCLPERAPSGAHRGRASGPTVLASHLQSPRRPAVLTVHTQFSRNREEGSGKTVTVGP